MQPAQKKWQQVTPAMAIGITDKWTLKELLPFQVLSGNNSTVKGP